MNRRARKRMSCAANYVRCVGVCIVCFWCYRLACPPFDSAAWAEACGQVSGSPSPTSSTASSFSASPLSPNVCLRSASMWGDMPWFVYMHHNQHLVKDLVGAPLVERPLSNYTVQGASSLLRSAASLSTSAGGFFRSFLQSTSQTPSNYQTADNPDTQAVVQHTHCSSAQSSSDSQPEYPTSHSAAQPTGETAGTLGAPAAPRLLSSSTSGARRDSREIASASGQSETHVTTERVSRTSVSDMSKKASSGNTCIDHQGLSAVRAPEGVCLKASPALRTPVFSVTSSPWTCWLERDKRKCPSLHCSIRRCQSRASSTGLAVWGGTACCIGQDGSVACFHLGEALQKCFTAKFSKKEKNAGALHASDAVDPRVFEREAAGEKVKGHSLLESEKRAGAGCIDGSSRFAEEGVGNMNTHEVPNSEGEEDLRSVDVSVLRSLAVYRLSSVPLCSTTFVGSNDVVAVGAFDGSIALHAVHTPQLDPFLASRVSESEEEESISTTRTRPSLNSVASTAARTSFPKGSGTPASSAPGSALGSSSFLPGPANRKSSALLSGLALSRPLSRQVCHADSVLALAYNPTLHLLASASSDATVRVWDVASLLSSSASSSSSNSLLLLQQVLDEHEGEVTAVSMHRHLLLSGNEDGVLLLFDLRLPSQRCGPVWGVQTPGNAPVQACGVSDCSAAAFLECISSSDFSDITRMATGVPSAFSGSLFGCSYGYVQEIGGAPPLSPYCVRSPSPCFPVQLWDLRGKNNGVPSADLPLHQPNYLSRARRMGGEEIEHSVDHKCSIQKKQEKPLCGVFDPAVQFGFFAGIRPKFSPGGGDGTDPPASVDRVGGRGKAGPDENPKPGTGSNYSQEGKEYEGFVSLYDLRTKKEEMSWSLEYVTEPVFMAASPSTAELAVMGGSSDGGGFSLGSSYVVVGDLQGTVEVLATGEICKRKMWCFS